MPLLFLFGFLTIVRRQFIRFEPNTCLIEACIQKTFELLFRVSVLNFLSGRKHVRIKIVHLKFGPESIERLKR
ncbi:hypothetical protein AQ714_00990 [Burkholderia pseudomallei]|nr:hypothetical protein AQ708_00925 [Burkholderia pseudomallei]OMQ62136.1 hypothetical protein AQ709_17230 [Burkholderia pseudomallei]OMQ63018.1 hypothetical protein AQ710_15555 [Burkholderia pseudomallei]OMQ67780.1 hypothetical protein AQ711_04070 [Burkholderia pseudomallei]OMQ76316.1 hypothetical protein AQ712_23500 [Burkholderia pseudomallei]